MFSSPLLDNALKDFALFLDEQIWTENTSNFYRYLMMNLFKWMEEESIANLEDLRIRDAKSFLKAKRWGNSMSRKVQSVLTQFVKWKYGHAHPLNSWKIRRKTPPPQRTLIMDQVLKIVASFQPGISSGYSNVNRRFTQFDTAHPLGIRNKAIILLMLETGLRSNEICMLEIDRLNQNSCSIDAKVKFGKWRKALFSERTRDALNNWLQVRPSSLSNKLFLGVMNGYKGNPLTPSGLRALCRKIGKATGIGKLSPHDFRRTFATLSIRNGASIQAVKEAGGWKSLEMVMHYTRAIRSEEIRPFLFGNLDQ
jgi:integrase